MAPGIAQEWHDRGQRLFRAVARKPQGLPPGVPWIVHGHRGCHRCEQIRGPLLALEFRFGSGRAPGFDQGMHVGERLRRILFRPEVDDHRGGLIGIQTIAGFDLLPVHSQGRLRIDLCQPLRQRNRRQRPGIVITLPFKMPPQRRLDTPVRQPRGKQRHFEHAIARAAAARFPYAIQGREKLLDRRGILRARLGGFSPPVVRNRRLRPPAQIWQPFPRRSFRLGCGHRPLRHRRPSPEIPDPTPQHRRQHQPRHHKCPSPRRHRFRV